MSFIENINWSRGLTRLSYVFFALVLIVSMFNADGPGQMGQYFVYWLIFVLGYMIVFKVLAWALNGFRKS